MPNPITRPALPLPHPAISDTAHGVARSAEGTTPRTDGRRFTGGLIQELLAMRTSRAPAINEGTYRRAVDDAVRVYLEQGQTGLRQYLAENRIALSALDYVGSARLQRDLEASLGRQTSGARSFLNGIDAFVMRRVIDTAAAARVG